MVAETVSLHPPGFDRPKDKAVEILSGSANVSSVPDELEQPGRLASAVVVPPGAAKDGRLNDDAFVRTGL